MTPEQRLENAIAAQKVAKARYKALLPDIREAARKRDEAFEAWGVANTELNAARAALLEES